MRYSRPGSSRGFALIELLITITILAFCLTGIALTYINLFVLSDVSRDTTLATNAVQAKMEDLGRISFANLSAQGGLFNLTLYGFPYANSTGRVVVQENFGGYSGNLTHVKVSACFRSRGYLVGDNATNCTSSPVEAVTLFSR